MSLSLRICHTVDLGDLVAEADEFAVDPSVAPCRVLGRETHDQSAQLDSGWWSARTSSGRLGPVPGDALAVPAQQGFGCHDPALAQSAGECRGDRPEKRPVVVVDGWPVDLAAKYLELVAKHDDLEVFRASGTDSEASKRSDETVEDAKHDHQDGGIEPWSAPTREFPSPTGSSVWRCVGGANGARCRG